MHTVAREGKRRQHMVKLFLNVEVIYPLRRVQGFRTFEIFYPCFTTMLQLPGIERQTFQLIYKEQLFSENFHALRI